MAALRRAGRADIAFRRSLGEIALDTGLPVARADARRAAHVVGHEARIGIGAALAQALVLIVLLDVLRFFIFHDALLGTADKMNIWVHQSSFPIGGRSACA